MTTCVEKIEHECGSHALQVFLNEDGSYSGFCFGCNTYVADPYKDQPKDYKPQTVRKSQEEIDREIAGISEYQTVDLPKRKLKKFALEYFGVKIGLSEADGQTPVSHHYPYTKDGEICAYKNRIIEGKKMWSSGDMKSVDLFGWEQAKSADGKKLFITEGELDAVALYQILKEKNSRGEYAHLNPPVVSLPTGAATAGKVLARLWPEIQKYFKEVVLVFDMDTPGKDAVEAVRKVIPGIVSASLPEKDVNDCLMAGKTNAAINAVLFKSEAPKSTRLVSAASVAAEARKPVEWGLSYPYKTLTELTRGRRFGETYYYGAGVKMGKSELLNDLVAWDIKEHGLKVFCIKPEESNKRTLQGVVGKMVDKIFHDPAIPFDHDAFDRGVEMVGDKLVMLNLYQELTWEVLKSDIRVAVAEGCRSIYIDPITVMSNQLNASDANTMLQKMAQELSSMAMELQVIIHIFCHLKSPEQGPSHERGGHVFSHQFAGSRAMMRSCNAMIGMEGNKDPELPIEDRNIRTLVLLEDRMTGTTGKVPLLWQNTTGAFKELNHG